MSEGNEGNEGMSNEGQSNEGTLGSGESLTSNPMEFVPESYREENWISKHKSPETFWASMKHQQALIGKKQIVQGLEMPGAESGNDEWSKFYQETGRPDDVAGYEFNNDSEMDEGEFGEFADTFGQLSHKHGLSKKQAEGLLNDYLETEKANYEKHDNIQEKNIQETIGELWGDNSEIQMANAKKGAHKLGLGDKLDSEGLSANPLVLQLAAALGESMSEASIKGQGEAPESREMMLEKATRLQRDPSYWNDEGLQRQVTSIFEKVYGTKPIGAAVSENDF